ncbi:MAG TPA: CHAT domain-containing protein [Oscillatoriaceae cyanobacterium M33_DOE_052]|uniref:CHAT domain-containing protein n=1 Tax=Planktothricoides sp. SpSt-374 TaxID=2282167 RepID=A0A7C3VLL9_9CYAN|nr:CHAT domain-containing protein [Oscillatoriaceae cyanobacterium M33_DOE_052]
MTNDKSAVSLPPCPSPIMSPLTTRALLPLSLLIPSGLSLSLLISFAQPLGAEPIPAADGTGTLVTPDGQRYDIHGGTLSRDGQNLFHSFQKFGLTPTETANFISNPDIRNILGRVVGGDPSIINGLIQITGGSSNLFLINPAGILFGANASLNVPADFTATTATGIGFGDNNWFNIFAHNDYASLTGTPSAFTFPSTQLGTIINEGNLTLLPGSNLNIFANTVINTGTITVPGGNINITAIPSSSPLDNGGSGGDYILRISQPGHILSLEIENTFVGVIRESPLDQPKWAELLTGGDPIHHATTVQKLDDGTIRLTGSQTSIPIASGVAVISGNVDVGGLKPNYELNILGDKIALIGANIDASGTNGGGNIHIGIPPFQRGVGGMEARGVGIPPFQRGVGGMATHTYIDPNTTITANAINKGNGGQIIIWSDNTTQFHGQISATGTENGGFVEVSGKQNLIFRGHVDLSSANGQTGTLLLDPENIIIVSGSGAADDGEILDNEIRRDDPGATYTISETALENLDGNAEVILEATNDITIENLSNNPLTLSFKSGSIAFTADADNDGNGSFSMNTGDIIRTGGRDITISAAGVTTGTINTNSTNNGDAGNITISSSGGDITTGQLNSFAQGSGAAGNVTLTVTDGNGSINTTSGDINAGSVDGIGGNISLSTAGGNITTGDLISRASGSGTGGNITLEVNGGTGAINTTAGLLNALSQRGQGGNITLSTADGDIATGEVTAGDINAGTSGNIIINVEGTTGSINTTAKVLRASSGVGDAGSVTLTTGGGNITTGEINARPSPTDDGKGGDITIEVSAGTGAIDTTAGDLSVFANGRSNAGNITLRTAAGDISTGNISALANGGGTAGSVTLEVTGGTGSIDTSGISSNVAIDSNANGGGNGGSILLSVAGGNITAGKLNSVAKGRGISGDIEITAPIGTVNFTDNVDSGNLNITGTEIDFTSGNSSINGSGELLLQPGDDTQSINIGTTEGTPGLDISATDLAALQNGFTAINIGVAEGTGEITLGDDASFRSPVTITGGSTLAGPNRETTWTLTGANRGNLSGYSNGLTFTNIENLTGGSASDKFVFNAGASLSGIIDGGPGIDSLNYSNFNASYTVNLAENMATATDGVFNIEEFIPDNTTTPPDGETPGGETPGGETPGGETPGGETPGGETPGGETPGGETPGGETPGGETPGGETPLFSPGTPSLPAVTEPEVSPVVDEPEVPATTPPQVQTPPVAPAPVTPNLPSITLSDSNEVPPPITAPVVEVPPPVTAPVIPVLEPVTAPVAEVPAPVTAPVIPVPEPVTAPVIPVPEPVTAPVIPVSEPVVTPVIQVSEPVTAPVIQVSEPVPNPDGLKPNSEPLEGLTPNYEGLTPNSELGVNVAIPLWAQPPQFTALEERFLESGTNGDMTPAPPGVENSILRLTSREDIGLLLAAGNVSEAAAAMDLFFSEEFENYLGYKSPYAYLSFGQLQNKLREQALLQKQKPAIIYIFARDNRLDLILVPSEGKPIYQSVTDAPREAVLAKVVELKGEIANPTRRRTTSYLPAAQQLYQWTIAPLEPDLKRLGIETLLVSMDAGLRTLPLAALHDGERFLVEKYSLSLIPSFYLTDIGVSDMRQAQVLAMGMSEFQDQSPLPAVPVEVKNIGQNLWSGEVFLNRDFTLANLQKLQESNRNGILHLATHGQFQSGQPANSYIQMWDQKLSLDEMRSLNWRDLNVELLVLSACRTAVGDEGVEFGFAGLAVASGVKTAVASLWYANDAATLGLMSEFYYQLRSAPTKAEALRRAQISMLRGNVRVKANETERELVGDFGSVPLPSPLADGMVLQHPYFWSGFTAIGSPW